MLEPRIRSIVEEVPHDSSRDVFGHREEENIVVAGGAERVRTGLQVSFDEFASSRLLDTQ